MTVVQVNGKKVFELKKRISKGMCVAAGCQAITGLSLQMHPMKAEPVLLCSVHASVVDVAPVRAEVVIEDPSAVDRGEITAIQTDAEASTSELATVDVTDKDSLDFVAELLADVKGKAKRLEAMRKTATDPMNEALATVRGWFRPAETALAKLETALKGKISDYHVRLEQARAAAAAQINDSATAQEMQTGLNALGAAQNPDLPATLQMRTKWVAELVDASLVPDNYWMINIGAVDMAIAHGVRDIPGFKISQVTIVASKAS
jgi:hypothetical protein